MTLLSVKIINDYKSYRQCFIVSLWVCFLNSSSTIGGPKSLLSSSFFGTLMSTSYLGHISIISSFMNSTKFLLYTVPHWVLYFLWGSVNALFVIILHTSSSFIWTSSPLQYLFSTNVSFSSSFFLLSLKEQKIHLGVFFPLVVYCVSSHLKQCSNFTLLLIFEFFFLLPLLLLLVPSVLWFHFPPFSTWHNILVRFAGALNYFLLFHILKIYFHCFKAIICFCLYSSRGSPLQSPIIARGVAC